MGCKPKQHGETLKKKKATKEQGVMVQDFNARMQERQGTDQSSLHSKQAPGHPRPALYQKVL